LSIVGLAVFSPANTAAQQTATSQECCVSLLFAHGARAVAMGHALATRSSPDGLLYNPSAIVGNGLDHFLAHHADTFDGQDNVFSLTIDAGGFVGAFGLTYVLIDQGTSETFDDFGNPAGTLNLRQQRLMGSYATSVVRGLRAGVSFMWYNEGGTCSGGDCAGRAVTATTHLVDFGLQYRPPYPRAMELGVAILHLGPNLQFVNAEQADPTPSRYRVGAAYELAHHFRPDTLVSVWLSAEAVGRVRDPGSVTGSFGLEASFEETIFLRAGYAGSGDGITRGGAGIGIGIRYQRYTIGVAKSFARSDLQPQGEPFQISFGITF
jgi:hypothetical protein